ncbi:MAG TPA: glycosyltransferase family 39 protein [Chloroflexota bacterium]|nr:glycosyltransferase family 39 protein [Chloroflexota bacterium]
MAPPWWRNLGALIAVAAALAYLALVGPQLTRPLMYDDANFALAIKAVAETGLPYGNQGWMSERGDFSQREQWALWHPPLYIYADALFARLGGWTPPVMRLLGVLSGLVTAALTYRLASDLTRGPPGLRSIGGGVAVALTLLCPLTIQSTLILDIDFPILLPLTLLFLIGYLRLEVTRLGWLWLAPLFGLLLWAKMTNPLPLVGILFVWQVLRGRFVTAALHAVGIGLGGALIFGVTWLAIGRWLGFPLDMPFGVNLVQWQDSAEIARRAYVSPGTFVEAMQPTVLWLGPGLTILGLLAIALRGGQLVRAWNIRGADLLIGLVAVFVLGYINKNAGWFPKYQVAFVPLLASLAAPLLAQAWCARPRLTTTVTACAVLTAALVTGRLVRDDWALQRTWQIEPTAGAWLLAIVVAAVLAGLPWQAAAATTLAGLFGLAVGWSLALDGVQLRAAYQTDYWYGTTGTVEAAAWVDSHLAPEQTYLAAKEVAIRSRDLRYVDQDNLVYALSIGRPFDGIWAGEPLRALVVWQREAYVAELFGRALAGSQFRETARFGDYVVYEPGPAS